MNDRLFPIATTENGWYSASQLAGLPGMPTTKVGVIKMATRENWSKRQRQGRGGGFEYPIQSLPVVTVQAILERHISPSGSDSSSLGAPSSALTPLWTKVAKTAAGAFYSDDETLLTDQQRLEKNARSGVLSAIERLMKTAGCSKEAAMTTLLTQARAGQMDQTLLNMLRLARDPRGRSGDGVPSIRTLKRWLSKAKVNALAPRKREKNLTVPAWAKAFLAIYQQPQKPTTAEAYRDFCKVWEGESVSIHQVRRWLDKIGTVSLAEGRMLPREIKAIKPFVRRTFDELLPNDVWSADGHTFDAEVQHPYHGRPFRPEITTIIDIRTRRVVGYSVDLAESSFAVLDAIRTAVEHNGIPAIFYTDNGSGYDNALMTEAGIGLMGRLGCESKNSLPYNAQAKGVIEKLNDTLWVKAAKRLPSYIGAKMDREAKLYHFKLTRKAIKQGGEVPVLGWDQFIAYADYCVAEYNARQHRSLKGKSPDQVWKEFRDNGWAPHLLLDGEADILFRPRLVRTAQRGEVQLFNHTYFSKLLTEFHGETVQVGYDIHKPEKVWIYDADGRFICTAEFMANARAYFPTSVVEKARDKRAEGRIKRHQDHIEEIEAERRGGRFLEQAKKDELTDLSRLAREMMAEPIKVEVERVAKEEQQNIVQLRDEPTPAQKFQRWLDLNKIVEEGRIIEGNDDLKFWNLYQQSNEFRSQMRLHKEKSQSTAAR